MILNAEQGSAREDVTTLSPDRQSPIQPVPTARPQHHTTHKYSPRSSSFAPAPTEEDFSDSSGGLSSYHPTEYPLTFLPSYSQTPEEASTYQYPQDVFYQYHHQTQHDPELTTLSQLTPTHQRPYSASSNSCSSSESEQAIQHIHSHNPYISDGLHPSQHFPVGCFNGPPHAVASQGEPGYVHEFTGKNLGHAHTSAQYTSVIVDTQQYHLANEFVH